MSVSKHEARTSLLSGSASLTQEVSPYYQPYAGGGYHEREGMYVSHSPKESRSVRLFLPNTKWTWIFLGIAIVQAIICLAIEGWVFARFQIDLENGASIYPIAKTVPTYLSLFIFGFIYQLLLVYDALRLKNTIQVIGLCIYNVGLLVEAAVQYDQIQDALAYSRPPYVQVPANAPPLIAPGFWDSIKPYIITLPCVLALGTVLLVVVTWKLYDEFAWSIYKNISADLNLKRRYLSYQIYIALLKFDFFFFLAFTVQFVVVVVKTDDIEFYLTIAAIPITVILLILAGYWTRKENKLGMSLIIVIYFAAMAYFCFKLVRMYFGPKELKDQYQPARHSLTTFACITIALLIVTIVYAIICTKNFKKGLRPHLSSAGHKRRAASMDMSKMYSQDVPLANTVPHRMTID